MASIRLLALALAAMSGACSHGGTSKAGPAAAQSSLSPADAAAIDAAIDGVYAVISGPADQPRDWDRMRSLFTPGARLNAITPKGLTGGTLDDYIARSGPLLVSSGFTETELQRRVMVYGGLAHVWSSYRGVSGDGKIDIRGINSFQLVRQPDGRWLVHSILWQPESDALPLPTDMEN